MRVFITGASGFIGQAVTADLINAGHQVVGLARSDASADVIAAAGGEVHRGDLGDLDSLRAGAADADGVIHLAFIHDFSDYEAAKQADRNAIETMGEALAGSARPLVVAAGIAGFALGRPLTEDDAASPNLPRISENAALQFSSRDVRVSVVRLPPTVHGEGDYGFVPRLIDIAREKGVSAYPGDGSNRWPAVHRFDAARAFRLALEAAPAGSRVHAIAEEGIPTRDIADVIGTRLGVEVVSVPRERAFDHFGWLGAFFAIDAAASSELTQKRLNWQPTHATLLDDLDAHYFSSRVGA
jgi:nucleoside-diphosphate-sugar epimerase